MLVASSFHAVDLATKVQFEPSAIIGLLGAGALYAYGIRRLAAKGRQWPLSRTIPFFVGLFIIAFALLSGLAAYDDIYFTCHVIQHILIGMLAPIFLCLGAPITLALQASDRKTRTRMLKVLHSRPAKIIGHPFVAWALFGGSLFVLYFSSLYAYTLHHPLVHDLVHVHFIVVGFLFFLPVVGIDPGPHPLPFGGRLVYLFLALPFHTILGMALISQKTPLAPGMTITDMQTGGGIMWTAGEFLGILGGALVLYRWMKSEEREAIRLDRQLDARLAAAASGHPSPSAVN